MEARRQTAETAAGTSEKRRTDESALNLGGEMREMIQSLGVVCRRNCQKAALKNNHWECMTDKNRVEPMIQISELADSLTH